MTEASSNKHMNVSLRKHETWIPLRDPNKPLATLQKTTVSIVDYERPFEVQSSRRQNFHF